MFDFFPSVIYEQTPNFYKLLQRSQNEMNIQISFHNLLTVECLERIIVLSEKMKN